MISDRIIFVEPFSGISGDMMLGALLDLGVDFERVKRQLGLLQMQGYGLSAGKCLRSGIEATRFEVQTGEEPRHRGFRDIRQMIGSSGLSDWVKEQSTGAFRRLAVAEGKVHGLDPEEVHFHEVGAVDSIVDIVGTMIALEELIPARFLSSAVNVGHGTVTCRHGIYPVPGPATQLLLAGIPIFTNEVDGELTTPTGATLLATLVERFGPRPLMKIRSSGYGAGSRDIAGNANVLRVTLGEPVLPEEFSADEEVAVIEATVDDMSPQVYGYFQEKAFEAGALDVYSTPVFMKKNRPAMLLTVVCAVGRAEALSGLIFAETTTIGLRLAYSRRKTLEREFRQVQTGFGAVTIKISFLDGRRVNFAPEYEDCRRLAAERGVALKDVMAAAVGAYLLLDAVDEPAR